ncbi:hypothetical protein TNCV_3680171 [Trichonephila clavipes]|nr:hypothetical protein TNCV_3680171 [Trichonephila clavipes]
MTVGSTGSKRNFQSVDRRYVKTWPWNTFSLHDVAQQRSVCCSDEYAGKVIDVAVLLPDCPTDRGTYASLLPNLVILRGATVSKAAACHANSACNCYSARYKNIVPIAIMNEIKAYGKKQNVHLAPKFAVPMCGGKTQTP